jgi:hypothetical protein
MPQQLLNRADVVPVFEQCRGNAVDASYGDPPASSGRPAARRRLRLSESPPRADDTAMAPQRGSRQIRVAGNTNCHRHSVAAFGYFRPTANGRRPAPRLAPHRRHAADAPAPARHQRLLCRRRKHRHPILVTLPLPHDDLLAVEVHILDAQLETLFQPEAGTVKAASPPAVPCR